MTYDLAPLKAPRLTGRKLKALCQAIEGRATRWMLIPKLLGDAGFLRFREVHLQENPTVRPIFPSVVTRKKVREPTLELSEIVETGKGIIAQLHNDFCAGRRDPVEVAEQVAGAIEAGNRRTPPQGALVEWDIASLRANAEASCARYRNNQPHSPVDGIPIAFKDEVHVAGFRTRVGTKFIGWDREQDADATAVARLRAGGCLPIGKACMHEIGCGVTGINLHYGTPVHPHVPGRMPGGSSGGSAVAVAAGLCPVALGADGGGSIRIPAALCGVVGLKPTYGRVSEHGAYPLCWSVGHLGPLAASVADCSIAYALIAGPDPAYPHGVEQPPVHLQGVAEALRGGGLEGTRIGVFRPWFEDADPEVARACREMLSHLEHEGATIVEVSVPDLELTRVAHTITIISEMALALDAHRIHWTQLGRDVRINLAIGRALTARDYVRAQQVRTRVIATWLKILEDVDVLATPTTGTTSPPIRKDALICGESDLTTQGKIMKFAGPGNLTGFPAITFPAGVDSEGLPVGFQVYGRPWEEHRLLAIAAVGERAGGYRQPPDYLDLLR